MDELVFILNPPLRSVKQEKLTATHQPIYNLYCTHYDYPSLPKKPNINRVPCAPERRLAGPHASGAWGGPGINQQHIEGTMMTRSLRHIDIG